MRKNGAQVVLSVVLTHYARADYDDNTMYAYDRMFSSVDSNKPRLEQPQIQSDHDNTK